jgi:hypothetical protein
VNGIYRSLKRGGYAQCGEVFGFFLKTISSLRIVFLEKFRVIIYLCLIPQLFEHAFKSFAMNGTPTMSPEKYKLLFQQAGSQEIQIWEKLTDLGDWRGEYHVVGL